MKHITKNFNHVICNLLAVLILVSAVSAQAIKQGTLLREKVHGVSLEKNVTGEAADRNVAIYLPPSYKTSPDKRYPVLYLLHGIGDTENSWVEAWTKENDSYATLQDEMDKGIAEGKFGEMIVVMPDERTNAFGSFYVNSSVTGNWGDFTTKDLVSYVDRKFRTLAKSESRGIGGHSMGGYGAITLGMKHPEVFSVVYGINPAVIGWGGDLTINSPNFSNILKIKSVEDLLKTNDLYTMATVTLAQAFSPNPNNPPFFADFPFAMVDGKLQPSNPTYSKWEENFPVNMVKTYKSNLLKLRGFRFDSGYEDEFKFIPINSRALSAELNKNGVEHIFEEYNGDHRNRMWSRKGRLYNEVLPYFWLLLDSKN
ncbi:MAG TPA: alpha/beta hydrolase-fold protein [Pyrinomonadaceae bacterium]|nr:alpha/beta hydrolase-fold protein [Pyrinomonadaceae bacterium]